MTEYTIRFTDKDGKTADNVFVCDTHDEALEYIADILTRISFLIEGVIIRVDNINVEGLSADDVREIAEMDMATLPHNLQKYIEQETTYLHNADGSLCDVQTWHAAAYDCWTHKTLNETVAEFRSSMEYYRAKGEGVAEMLGYTQEILDRKIKAAFAAYNRYLLSGGVVEH